MPAEHDVGADAECEKQPMCVGKLIVLFTVSL